MVRPEEDVDEEYELTADDIPQFVQKFEVPKDLRDEEEIIEQRQIELIQPNSETPTFVQPSPPSELIDAEESGVPLLINHNWSQKTSMEMVGLTNSKRHSQSRR